MFQLQLRPARVKLLAAVLFLFLLSLFSSCSASRNPRSYSWNDLKHSRELDAKKGKQLKKLQKPYAKRYNH